MTKQSTFCRSYILFESISSFYCGKKIIECGHGDVINVLEVEKGDKATCIFGTKTCGDDTSLNQDWTYLIKRDCNGKRKCDTSTVKDEQIRTIKTVYNCTQEPHTDSSTKDYILYEKTTQPNDPSRHLTFISTPEPKNTSDLTTTTYTEQSSASNFFQSTPSHLKSEDKIPPLVTTVAVSSVTFLAVVMLVAVILVCRKRKLNTRIRDSNSCTSTTRPRIENADLAENEASMQPQPIENSQYENGKLLSRSDTALRDGDYFIIGQSENNQYDHLGTSCQNPQQKSENVYNVANFNGADLKDDNVYNNFITHNKKLFADDEYDIANNATQNRGRFNEFSTANNKDQLFVIDNDYDITNPVNENVYSFAKEETSFVDTVIENHPPHPEEEDIELHHEYDILSPLKSQNPSIDEAM